MDVGALGGWSWWGDADEFVGLLWGPNQGAKKGFELRSKARVPADPEEFNKAAEGKDE